MKNLSTYEHCRLDSDYTFGRGLWYRGQHYYIDRNMDFVRKHSLPRIAQVISFGGKTFDIFRGIGRSTLGNDMEFACAVYTGQVE